LSLLLFSFDGAVLPVGLGLSLLLNAAFLARHINSEKGVLTLPDILGRRYGKLTEIVITCACIVSFIMLLAGNLVGMGNILSYVLDVPLNGAIWTASILIWAYTISGGMFSVAYTDVVQGILGWSGCVVCVFYLIVYEEIRAPPPSIGLPG
jgi:Na+/proline symporter